MKIVSWLARIIGVFALLVGVLFAAARFHDGPLGLVPGGALVAKVFHGSGYSQLVQRFKQQFRVVKAIKPKASRDKSSETFLVGMGLKRQ